MYSFLFYKKTISIFYFLLFFIIIYFLLKYKFFLIKKNVYKDFSLISLTQLISGFLLKILPSLISGLL